MSSLAIIGLQWGDEGKGKITDYIAQDFDIIVRYAGGPNAGHTIYFGDQKLVFHQIPSGILNPKSICIIGRGCVLDLTILQQEINQVINLNIDIKNRLFIDTKTHLIFPYHKAVDQYREEALGKKKIGTTIRGIGPCYEDKYARIGIRFGDLRDEASFAEKFKRNLAQKNFLLMELYKAEPLPDKKIYDEFCHYASLYSSMCINGADYLNTAYENNKKILFEGAQGTLLDIDHGTYPYVTSSSPTVGGICTGTGVGLNRINNILGITKAYTTRVGSGPFPTELFDSTGQHIQTRGHEFGAATGRPRRCGWFDAPLVRYTATINGIKQLVITKLDVLDELAEISIAVGYTYKGEKIKDFDPDLTAELKPEYLKLEGWQKSTKTAKSFDDLPKQARKYLDKIEELTNCKISILSVGEKRNETILSPNFTW
jgi:adenylosuccinate synthase